MIQANLEAFASIGLAQNDYISRVCQMDQVTPAYILGQKKRLEAERRYSPGLLLTVIQCKDALPEKYTNCDSSPPLSPIPSPEQRSERCSPSPLPLPSDVFVAAPTAPTQHSPEIEPDPSIHEPLSTSGLTPAKAWPAVLRELQRDMPKAAYDKWVRDTVLLSARDGTFVVGALSGYARDWLESRLTSTIARLLAGICNRSMAVIFVDLAAAASGGRYHFRDWICDYRCTHRPQVSWASGWVAFLANWSLLQHNAVPQFVSTLGLGAGGIALLGFVLPGGGFSLLSLLLGALWGIAAGILISRKGSVLYRVSLLRN